MQDHPHREACDPLRARLFHQPPRVHRRLHHGADGTGGGGRRSARGDRLRGFADIPGTLFLAGGVPVTSDDAPIAGIGVGGAPSGDIDEEIAQAALEALEDYEG
ncbi:heme-binding protein [Nocardiopsis alba]